jgi:hypothetical protein
MRTPHIHPERVPRTVSGRIALQATILAAAALLLPLAPGSRAAAIAIVAAQMPGPHLRLPGVESPLVAVPEDGLGVPLELPPGRVRITARLHWNGKGSDAFRQTRVWLWVGPDSDWASVAEIAAGEPLVLNLVTRRPGRAELRVSAADMPPAAVREYNALKQEASIQANLARLTTPGGGGVEEKLLDEELATARPPAAADAPLPTVLLERLEIESLPPPTRAPEIANVVPYIRVAVPFLVVAEPLDEPDLEVWSWQPPTGDAEIRAGAEALAAGGVALPVVPPADARREVVLDTVEHGLLAELAGDVLWLRNRHGWSQPHLCNVARPFWLSRNQAAPGDVLFLFGYGLRPPGGTCHVLLRRGDAVRTAEPAPADDLDNAGQPDRYLAHVRLPRDLPPGAWTVYVNNGAAGRYGWATAGELTVTAAPPAERLFSVLETGADGSDTASDRAAILAAMTAAHAAGGGVVVLPPGRYLVEETLPLPKGVILRGAGRDRTVLEGFGYDAAVQRVATEYRDPPSVSPLLVFADGTGAEDLRVTGAVAKGPSGFHEYPMLLVRHAIGVRIERCEIDAATEEPERDAPLYGQGVWVTASREVRIADCRIRSGVSVAWSERVDLLRNHVHSALNSVVSMNLMGLIDSRIDGNVIADRASRFCPIAGGAHNLIRRNALHHKFIGEVASPEGFLLHGGFPTSMTPGQPTELCGTVTDATPRTLTDRRLHLTPDLQRGTTVQIVAGRGFGQYRVVTRNTADTLTVDRPWAVRPDETSRYLVRRLFTEVAMVGNLNDSHSISLWYYDWTGCIVDGQRDDHAPAALWGGSELLRTPDGRLVDRGLPGPSWFNLWLDWRLDGGHLVIDGSQIREPLRRQAPLFGNFFVGCRITSPRQVRVSRGCEEEAAVTLLPTIYGMPGCPETGGENWPAACCTVFAGNRIEDAPIGFRLGPLARKTFLLDNEFRNVREVLVDASAETLLRGNRWIDTGADGTIARERPLPDARNPRVIVPAPRAQGGTP